MTVRGTMANLIARVRELIDDSGDSPVWSDQQVQDRLDPTRLKALMQLTQTEPVIDAGTLLFAWHDFAVPYGDWEDGVVLQGISFADITSAATIDLIDGRAHFASSQLPPVYWSGNSYDPYAAAAGLLRMWAAKVARKYDATQGDTKLARSQMREGLLALAHEYDSMSRVVSADIGRGDTPADD